MANTGRNDPCPCGSGRKYKRCCLTADAERAAGGARTPGRSGRPGGPPAGGTASMAGTLAPPRPAPPPVFPDPPPFGPAHAATPVPATVTVGDVTLRVLYRVKAVRYINTRLVGNDLHVSAPLGVSPERLREAIEESAASLVRRRERRRGGSPGNGAEGPGSDLLLEAARRVAARFPVPPEVAGVEYTDRQVACWGTYSRATRRIRLTALVRHMPAWVRDAVLAHELAHAVHFDHGPEFWDLVHRVCPDTLRAREFLTGVQWATAALRDMPAAARDLLIRAGEAAGNGPGEGTAMEESS